VTTRQLVTATEAARILDIPAGTIRSWRHRKHITPVMIDADKRVLYDLVELREAAGRVRSRDQRHAAEDSTG
jgi:DNA-binding transcriptional MerR regulator